MESQGHGAFASSLYSCRKSIKVVVLDGQHADVLTEVAFVRASYKSACYQKYIGGEIEAIKTCRHFLTQRHLSDPVLPLSLPLKAETWGSHSDPPAPMPCLSLAAAKPPEAGSV